MIHRLRNLRRRPQAIAGLDPAWLTGIAYDESAAGAWWEHIGEVLTLAVDSYNAFELEDAGRKEHERLMAALLEAGRIGKQLQTISAALDADQD